MNSAEARAKLLQSPREFLKYYPIKCVGTTAPQQDAVNQSQYYLHKRDEDQPAIAGITTGHRGATRPGLFGHVRQISSFTLLPTVSGTPQIAAVAATINAAHVVPMVNYNGNLYGCLDLATQTATMPHYILDATGDGVMVTGGLSNCCFCFLPQGANLWCIHVQPVGIGPEALQNRLALHGRFAAAPHGSLGTFGRNDYPMTASVIGVRSGGVWALYAQTSNDGFNTLAAAFRIYPGATTRL